VGGVGWGRRLFEAGRLFEVGANLRLGAYSNKHGTPYYLHSFSYIAFKLLNSLPDSFRTPNFSDFSRKILRYDSF